MTLKMLLAKTAFGLSSLADCLIQLEFSNFYAIDLIIDVILY